MYHRSFVILGRRSCVEWLDFLEALTTAIGMNPIVAPAIWTYPMEGTGGVGLTIVQPITESFIALDTWDEHAGAYLFICSCKPFDRRPVFDVVRARGLGMDMERSYEMSIPIPEAREP